MGIYLRNLYTVHNKYDVSWMCYHDKLNHSYLNLHH